MENSNSVLLVAVIVFVCLAGGVHFIRLYARRADNPDIDTDFLESRQFPEYPENQSAARDSAPRKAVNPAPEMMVDLHADPVMGANILSQSGRMKEAEQVLIRASLASPERNDTLLALLDLYISTRDEKGVTGVMCLLKTKTLATSPERERATRAFDKSGIKWSAEMQEKFDNLVEKASSEI